MPLRGEAERVKALFAGLTENWPVTRIELGLLDRLDALAINNQTAASLRDEILQALTLITRPEDYAHIAHAYTLYAEGAFWVLAQGKGVLLIRTPGTGEHGEKRPDFEGSFGERKFYIELKTLDFSDGNLRHRALANDALESNADLEARARAQGVHFGEPIGIASDRPDMTIAERIDVVVRKILGNAKMDQLSFGPTILVVDLTRYQVNGDHPSSLVPTYYDSHPSVEVCVSGELWHIAFGKIGDQVFCAPHFHGETNLDGRLTTNGVLHEYPYLLAIAFLSRTLAGNATLLGLHMVTPDFSGFAPTDVFEEHEVSAIVQSLCDKINDSDNGNAYLWSIKD